MNQKKKKEKERKIVLPHFHTKTIEPIYFLVHSEFVDWTLKNGWKLVMMMMVMCVCVCLEKFSRLTLVQKANFGCDDWLTISLFDTHIKRTVCLHCSSMFAFLLGNYQIKLWKECKVKLFSNYQIFGQTVFAIFPVAHIQKYFVCLQHSFFSIILLFSIILYFLI